MYFGLAFASLIVFTILFALSIHFGIAGKFRFIWIGFAGYTGLLFWVVARQGRPHWYRRNFWLVILAFLAIHCFVFANMLRVYPEWRPIWFWPITIVEAAVLGAILEWLFPEKHARHHRRDAL